MSSNSNYAGNNGRVRPLLHQQQPPLHSGAQLSMQQQQSESNNSNNFNDEGDNDSETTPLVKPRGSRSSSLSSSRRLSRTPSKRELWVGRVSIGASLVSILLCAVALLWILATVMWGKKNSGDDSGKQQPWGGSSGTNPEHNKTPSAREDLLEQMRQRMKEYSETSYDDKGRFVLEDYDVQQPFSDFLPALAGYYGKPLYAFYVNRGQGIASFGFRSKDYPIQEFHSANLAYQQTPFTGFRTFLQISPAPKQATDDTPLQQFKNVEPFGMDRSRFPQMENDDNLPKRKMYVGLNEMRLQEVDRANGIETNVTYFVLPEEDFGAFVKRTTITNILPPNRRFRKPNDLSVSILDGLAQIIPAGGKMNELLKSMGRTLEAWMGVYSPYNDTLQMPYYRLSAQPSDTASVTMQEAGHWCLSVFETSNDDSEPILLPIVFDPERVFGGDTTFIRPLHLYENSISDIVRRQQQYGLAKTASAFAAVENAILAPGDSLTITTYYGKADHVTDVPVVARRVLESGFAQFKEARSREVVHQITGSVETHTAIPLFDGHVQQMFLDNSLRGGIPALLGEVDDEAKMRSTDEDGRLKSFHVFSRRHGDLERDYNNFKIEPTFFSNGPGSYRDIVQNRRNDVMFNPRIGSFNVLTFLSFIQADGYEPLEVQANVLTIDDLKVCQQIGYRAVGEADGHRQQREALTGILNSGPFRPGQIFSLMEEQNIELIISRQEFIDMVAAAADIYPMAVYSSGFWADHWTYYVDLIESFTAVYPDWEGRIMFDNQLPYYFSPALVQPRDKKYVLSKTYDGLSFHVRQLNATTEDDHDIKLYERQFILNTTGWYDLDAQWQHDEKGNIFTSNAISKLFVLAALKFATRDPYGVAIEYEAGKPGWNDANNGLVGMIGSGTPELSELAVLIRYILSVLNKYERHIRVPTELYTLVESIDTALDSLSSVYSDSQSLYPKVPLALFQYWDLVSSAREAYRESTKVTFSGSTKKIENRDAKVMLERWLYEIDLGMARAYKLGTHGFGDTGSTGIMPTYFSYNVTDWEKTGEVNYEGHPFVRAKEMIVNLFPLFLEGPTRAMKTNTAKHAAKDVYEKVRSSPLRDTGLKMYLISASLEGESFDMGREMAFATGWLENQSVWLHMSYKFYLELLRHKMYDEFFDEMLAGGILPFMDQKVYGRSLMECSSFLASSAFEDPSDQGRGFLARLSGSTAEFLSMWVLMFIGPNPFYMDEFSGRLQMWLIPSLPRWLFDDSCNCGEATVSFKLFSSIDVTYHHRRGNDDLFNAAPTRYVIVLRDGTVFRVPGPSIGSELADKIRRVVFVATIDAYFE